MESNENFYKILGVTEKSTDDEIKRAYRKLQMKYHPDKTNGDRDMMQMSQKINEAYETLGDPEKRRHYDMTRNNPFFQQMNDDVDIGDIFSAFFGGGGSMPPGVRVFHGGFPSGFPPSFHPGMMQKPTPIIKNIIITMDQVFNGASIPVDIERWVVDNGEKTFEKETIYVDIPQGIDDHEMIILRDKGNVVNENAKGDIKIIVKVENNTPFKRCGLDLVLDKTITLKESLCGFSFELERNGKSYTLNNSKGNMIPPEYRKVYTGLGLKRGEHTGNMIIIFHIDFPKKLSGEQIDKLAEIL